MIKRLTAVAALAAALMLAPTSLPPAHALTGLGSVPAPASGVTQVRHFGGGGMHIGHIGGGFRGHAFHGGGGLPAHFGRRPGGFGYRPHGFRPRFYGGPSVIVGAPYRHRRHFYGGYGAYPYAYSGGYYGRGCSWLKVRAIETGDPYWWQRYEDCID